MCSGIEATAHWQNTKMCQEFIQPKLRAGLVLTEVLGFSVDMRC